MAAEEQPAGGGRDACRRHVCPADRLHLAVRFELHPGCYALEALAVKTAVVVSRCGVSIAVDGARLGLAGAQLHRGTLSLFLHDFVLQSLLLRGGGGASRTPGNAARRDATGAGILR